MIATTFIQEDTWQGKAMMGSWRTTKGGVAEVKNIATDEVIAKVGIGSPADVAEAAKRAAKAQIAWAARPAQERADIINKAADLLIANKDEFISWIQKDLGAITGVATVEVVHGETFIRHAAKVALQPMTKEIPSMDDRVSVCRRVPHGVVGVIAPFNFPFVLSIRAIAPALALGNAVIIKPDPRTPIAGGIITARIFEAAGLPEDLLHIIPGGADVGSAIIEAPEVQMIAFTGSAGAGSKVGELAGKHLKKVSLELGGKNSMIVTEEVDLDVAASNCAWGSWLHQGQVCMATDLVIVNEKIDAALTERMVTKAKNLPYGDPSKGLPIGPLINESQAKRAQAIIDDAVNKGAKLLAGGKREGKYIPATVLHGVKPGMRAFSEEIFAPVVCIVPVSSDQAAVDIANASEFGLAGSVLCNDLDRANAIANQLQVGMLHINDQTINGGAMPPFGGFKNSGNGSRTSGPADIEEYTQWQWVSTKKAATPYPF